MNLPEFFTSLASYPDRVPIDRLVELIRQLDVTLADVASHVAFDDEHYKRNVLKVGPGYAALVLCWKPGQASPIHDHRGSACGVLVLDGVVTETKYERGDDGMLRETATGTLAVGDVCGSCDTDIHIVRNDEEQRDLVTLHVYTPPLRDIHVYRLDSTEVETCTDVETLEAQRRLAASKSTVL